MSKNNITFIHLSDIHFHKPNSQFDLDEDLRDRLEDDIRVKMMPLIKEVDGIIVTGDIAYSGKLEEYEVAGKWLEKIAEIVHIAPENVYVTPGNHDVDQSVIGRQALVQDIHSKIRGAKTSEASSSLTRYLSDESAVGLLFKPLENYNFFAQRFNCTSIPERVCWQRDLPFAEGLVLRLRGINSALISDAADDDRANKLIVGAFQSIIPKKDGVANISLCHHPPDWLIDGSEVDTNLVARAQVQLFGHKHKMRLRKVDNSLIISSGAVHPSRAESDWEPRYNVIRLSFLNDGKFKQLEVVVWPRVWDKDNLKFKPHFNGDGLENYNFLLPLEVDQVAGIPGPLALVTAGKEGTPKMKEEEINIPPDTKRTLVYHFFGLPYTVVLDIAVKLNLLEEKDRGLTNFELFGRLISRAEENNQFPELWELVKKKDPSGRMPESPYIKSRSASNEQIIR